jgi:peptide/nickel transport system substrate-binding protein
MLRARLIAVLGLLVTASMILSACGGATATQPPTSAATEPPAPAATEPPATAAPTMADTIIIGTWQQPRGFYTPAVTQAIAVEISLIFQPRFFMPNNYQHVANPVLDEGDLPTLENGGAVLNDVTVKAGDPIFSTETYAVEAAAADTQAKQLVVPGHIKAGLKWDDGQPLTTNDFVLAWKTNCTPDGGAIDLTYCPLSSTDGATGLLTNYEAPDDTTFVMTYVPGALDPSYYYIGFGPYGALPSHIFKDMAPADIAADERATGGENAVALGYGPYKMVEWKKGDHITFAPNEFWAGEAPKTPNIIYKFYSDSTSLAAGIIAGEIDSTSGITGLAVDQAPYMESVAKRGLVNYTVDKDAASFEMLYINYDDPSDTTFKTPHPVLSEFCVRKAMGMGIDRQKMVDTIYYGDSAVVNQPHLPQMVSYDETQGVVTFDVEGAKKTLEDCGWVDSDGDGFREKNGVKAAFNYLTTSGNAPRQKASQVFQANMKDLGIDVTLGYQPSSVVFSGDGLYGRNFNVIQFANVFSNTDPGSWWFGVANCGQVLTPENNFAGSNYAGWCYKPASDAVAEAAYQTLDTDKRKADWNTALAAYFSENDAATDYHSGGFPVIALYTRPDYLATNPGLSGAALDPTEYFTWNVATWTLKPAE